MQRFTLAACAGLLACAVAGPSLAADLSRPAFKAPAASAPFNWTGFYVGINGGYAWGTSNWTDSTGAATGNFNVRGGMVGGTIGYNLQTSQFVLGAEGDIDASWIKGTDATACCETKNDWFATARARVGYAFDRWMPFVTGGAAFADVKMTPGGLPSETETKIGWTAGGGLEYAFQGAWSAKVEYLYADLGKANCSAATCALATDVNFKTSIVRGGVNYHF